MALPTNTFYTGVSIGNREDLSNIIYNIAPLETPFMTAVDKGKASAILHEWQTQDLRAAAQNAVGEGEDAVINARTPTVRLNNYCQISDETAKVSGTQQAIDKAGRDDELSYQVALAGKELKRDLEFILVGSNTAKSSGSPRYSASILSWIKTNNSSGATGSAPSTADGAATRTDGTQRAFTEALLKGVLQSCWTNGGEPDTIMVGGHNKQQFSTFVGRGTPTEDVKSKKIVASVDAYESDFGTLKVVANRFSRSRDCLVLEMDKWGVDYLRNMKRIDLATTGDNKSAQMLCEYTLVSRNEKASGIVADLTTS